MGLRVESTIVGGDEPTNHVRIFSGRKLVADIEHEASTEDIVAAFVADNGIETELD